MQSNKNTFKPIIYKYTYIYYYILYFLFLTKRMKLRETTFKKRLLQQLKWSTNEKTTSRQYMLQIIYTYETCQREYILKLTVYISVYVCVCSRTSPQPCAHVVPAIAITVKENQIMYTVKPIIYTYTYILLYTLLSFPNQTDEIERNNI